MMHMPHTDVDLEVGKTGEGDNSFHTRNTLQSLGNSPVGGGMAGHLKGVAS